MEQYVPPADPVPYGHVLGQAGDGVDFPGLFLQVLKTRHAGQFHKVHGIERAVYLVEIIGAQGKPLRQFVPQPGAAGRIDHADRV